MAITKLVLNGTEYEIGNIVNTTGPMLYDGIELEDYSWADLQAMCTAGDFENLREGDYKTIELTTGETVVCQIAGIDTYYRGSSNTVGHHLDFVSKDCMSDTVQWNTSATNNGNSTNSCPYLVSNLYSWLTGTVYNTVPTIIQNVLSEKYINMENRYSSTTSLTDSTGWSWSSIGYIWVPSEYEVFGSQIWGTKGQAATCAVQYPLFAYSTYHKIKGAGNGGSPCSWWLSTVRSGTSAGCCDVSNNGGAYGYSASVSFRAPLCFRIEA